MEEPKDMQDQHGKAYLHIKRHKKKYSRFVLFFILLAAFRVIEDYYLIRSMGIEFEFDAFIFLSIIVAALLFTLISEVTEKFIEEEEAKKLLEFIMEKEPGLKCFIDDERRKIKRRINRKS
jgi:hypothetical protein